MVFATVAQSALISLAVPWTDRGLSLASTFYHLSISYTRSPTCSYIYDCVHGWEQVTALRKGAPLLKYCRGGKPHVCLFKLSADEANLTWESRSNKVSCTHIQSPLPFPART